MSRVPIRLRLTAAFAVAMVLVLAGAGLFVYLRLQADLDESVRAGLRARAAAVAASGQASAGAAGEAEDGFAQRLGSGGGVLDAVGGAREPVLTAAELGRAARQAIEFERRVHGIEGTARVFAGPAGDRGEAAAAVLVVGQSLEDRDETLAGLAASFAIGGPIAVLLASVLGYALAAAGLAPVEAMRRRATRVSLERPGEGLPLPAAHDEIRRLGETLNAMLDRLHDSYERERRFVGDASHELRTPLAVIKVELEGALRAGRDDPDVHAALTAALEECDQLAQLTEDLLVLARGSEGRLPLRRQELELRELLDRVRERFADRARARERTIRVDAAGDPRLEADGLRLGQALANLVDNALRHGDGDVVLRARTAGAATELEVVDSGSGFPAELGEHAFDRFARGDAARTRDGAGLGLAIVRAIAEAHGGSAAIVADRPGATVRISIPRTGPLDETVPQGHLSGRS